MVTDIVYDNSDFVLVDLDSISNGTYDQPYINEDLYLRTDNYNTIVPRIQQQIPAVVPIF